MLSLGSKGYGAEEKADARLNMVSRIFATAMKIIRSRQFVTPLLVTLVLTSGLMLSCAKSQS